MGVNIYRFQEERSFEKAPQIHSVLFLIMAKYLGELYSEKLSPLLPAKNPIFGPNEKWTISIFQAVK